MNVPSFKLEKMGCGSYGAVFRVLLPVATCCTLGNAVLAQEALYRSLAADRSTTELRSQLETMPYTLRWKDLRILVSPSFGLEYTDNVNLAHTNAEDDFILSPNTSFHLSHPIGAANLLSVDVGVGYSKFVNHSELDRLNVMPGSALSLNMIVGDVLLNVHDRFSYHLDPIVSGAVSGVGQFGGMDNSAGISASRNFDQTSGQVGYDFVRSLNSMERYAYLDRSSHQFLVRGQAQVHPALALGVESTASVSGYDISVLNDSVGYSGGVFGQWVITERLRVTPRVGYSFTTFSRNAEGYLPGDVGTVYYGLELNHRISPILDYRVSLNKEVRPGVNSNLNEVFTVELSTVWRLIQNLPLTASVVFEDAQENASAQVDSYKRMGGTVTASYELTERVSIGLTYSHMTKTSQLIEREYAQNRVTLMVSYRF